MCKNIKKFPYGFYCMGVLFSAFFAYLSFWQFQRLEWKESLIEKQYNLFHSNPMSLKTPLENNKEDTFFFRKYKISGHFIKNSEIFIDAILPKEFRSKYINHSPLGYEVFALFSSKELSPLVISLGWISKKDKNSYILPKNTIKLIVYPKKQPALYWWEKSFSYKGNNRLTRVNLSVMASYWHISIPYVYFKAIKILTPMKSGFPLLDNKMIQLPNNHLNYALTWLAISLIILVMLFLSLKMQRKSK